MKKVLIGILVLVLAYFGAEIYFEFFHEYPCLLSQEQAEAQICGTWEDPLGDYPNYVFNPDGTGMLGDIPVTWTVDRREDNISQDIHKVWILVECRDSVSDNVYKVSADYYAAGEYTEMDPYYIMDKSENKILSDERDQFPEVDRDRNGLRFKAGTYDAIQLTPDNWSIYFEIVQKPYFSLPSANSDRPVTWSYDSYMVLKPEFIPRTLNISNKDYPLPFLIEYTAAEYRATANYSEKIVTLGEKLNVDDSTVLFQFPRDASAIYKKPYLIGDIFLKNEDFVYGLPLCKIELPHYAYNDTEEGTAYIVDSYTVHDCRGMMLLLK